MNTETLEAFTVSGPSVRTSNALEASGHGKLAALWAGYFSAHPPSGQTVYGVYSDYQSGATGDYTVTAGTRSPMPSEGSTAEGATTESTVMVRAGTYLVFPANGPLPAAIIGGWMAVWQYFATDQPWERTFETDFEQYDGLLSAAIYIGVRARD